MVFGIHFQQHDKIVDKGEQPYKNAAVKSNWINFNDQIAKLLGTNSAEVQRQRVQVEFLQHQ